MEKQDRSLWRQELIAQGVSLLTAADPANDVTAFQLEAAIASEHCMAVSFEETPWSRIVDLYNALLDANPSPIVSLNRAASPTPFRQTSAAASLRAPGGSRRS